MPLSRMIGKYTGGYKLNQSQGKINHLMYITGNHNTGWENIQRR